MMRFSFYKYLDSVWKSLRVTVINILSWPFYLGKGSGVLSWLFFSFISQAPQFTYLTTLCPSLDYLQQRACGCRVLAQGWGGWRTALSSCVQHRTRAGWVGGLLPVWGGLRRFCLPPPLPLPFTVPRIMCRVPQGSTHRAGHLQEGSRRSPPAAHGSARFPNISLTVSSWVKAEMKMDPPHELLL